MFVLAQDPTIELVLSDNNMGTMSGLDLLAHTRSVHPTLAFILMSGNALPSWLPAQGIITLAKPFPFAVLDDAITRAMAWRRATNDSERADVECYP